MKKKLATSEHTDIRISLLLMVRSHNVPRVCVMHCILLGKKNLSLLLNSFENKEVLSLQTLPCSAFTAHFASQSHHHLHVKLHADILQATVSTSISHGQECDASIVLFY